MAQTFDLVTRTYTDGIRDNSLVPSVDERIGLFSPDETPFMANMSSKAAVQTREEWLEDELDPVAANANLEAFVVEREARKGPARMYNVTQIFKKQYNISGTAKKAKMYGRSSDLERQRGLATQSLARDMEFAFLNGKLVDGGTTGNTARELRGALDWAATNARYNFGGAGAAGNQITEKVLIDNLQAIWDNGVSADTVMCGMFQKRKISAFTDKGRLHITQNADAKKVTMSVRVIETDMGTVAVMANRWIQPTDAAGAPVAIGPETNKYDSILNYRREMFVRRPFRPVANEELAKIGDSDAYFIVAEQTLQCRSQKGVGRITLLSRTTV